MSVHWVTRWAESGGTETRDSAYLARRRTVAKGPLALAGPIDSLAKVYSLPPSTRSRGQDPLPRRIKSDRFPPSASSKNDTTTA